VAEPELTLIASLRPAALDARRGVVRLHPEVLTALALRPGDPVRMTGRRQTAGIAAKAEPGAGTGLLHADDLVLGNLGVRDGGQVTLSPMPLTAAGRVTLRGPLEIVAAVSPEMLRLALLGKVVTTGDDVSLLPQDVSPDAPVRPLVEAARRSLANTVGYAWTSALLTVVTVEPGPGSLVTMDTVVGWEHGQVTHGNPAPAGSRATALGSFTTGLAGLRPSNAQRHDDDTAATTGEADPAQAPDVDELPGLRTQAEELTELLDLGFHHREVLGKLNTTVSLGVLLSGPAGSGKSALVRAVAAAVRARVHPVWAPELAALTNRPPPSGYAPQPPPPAPTGRRCSWSPTSRRSPRRTSPDRWPPSSGRSSRRPYGPGRRWWARPAGRRRSTRRCAPPTCSPCRSPCRCRTRRCAGNS
jgi:transitional endoplasmic reticulum ATPase